MKEKCKVINIKIRELRMHVQANPKENASYKRNEKVTNVIFTEAGMKLLDKSLKYNRHYIYKDWINTLTIESDTVISKIHERDQKRMTQTAANNIKKFVEMRHKRPHRVHPKENKITAKCP
jgi:hypothetical protein